MKENHAYIYLNTHLHNEEKQEPTKQQICNFLERPAAF